MSISWSKSQASQAKSAFMLKGLGIIATGMGEKALSTHSNTKDFLRSMNTFYDIPNMKFSGSFQVCQLQRAWVGIGTGIEGVGRLTR